MSYDVFISYRRRTGADDARLLQQALRARGYEVFFDYDSLRDGTFDEKIFTAIDEAPVFVLMLTEGALDRCVDTDDWVRMEIEHAIRRNCKIISVAPSDQSWSIPATLPESLKKIRGIQVSEMNKKSLFEASIDQIVAARFPSDMQFPTGEGGILAISGGSVAGEFKFYSNENCTLWLDGNPVGTLEGKSGKPLVKAVQRKGDYHFTLINSTTGEKKERTEHIDQGETRIVDVEWIGRKPLDPDMEWPERPPVSGERYRVQLASQGFAFDLIRVEGGPLSIGATPEQRKEAKANEYPVHAIRLQTFYMGQYPVTQNLWMLVMGYSKSLFEDTPSAGDSTGGSMWPFPGIVGSVIGLCPGVRGGHEWLPDDKGHLPAESLSLDEAREFVRRLSSMTRLPFALPTEEEWEYAARGGQRSRGFLYAGSDDIDEVAWHRGNSGGQTHPVGEKKPNELGLYDMSGNIWEWTESLAAPYNSTIKPKGDCFIRRGGSWWHMAQNCRVARRYASDRTKRTSGLGLRVVIRSHIA